MHLVGLDIFGLDAISKTTNYVSKNYRVELTNQICDQVHLRRNTSQSFNANQDTWQPDSIFLANFKDNLEAGNISLNSMPVTKLKFYKRKASELTWTDVAEVDYIEGQTTYEILDRFCEANETLEYAVRPCADELEGVYKIAQIDVMFDAAFIFDKASNYKLLYNYQLGDIDIIQQSTIVETLGNKFPIALHNGDLLYHKGSVTCLLVTDATINNNKPNLVQEKRLRQQITSFLTNKKPKAIKTSDGLYMMISIIGQPRLTPYNSGIPGMFNLSFEFVEIGDLYNSQTLIENGLL